MPDGAAQPIGLDSDAFARLMTACGFIFETPRHMCVAVSGGADSLALALLAHHWGQDNAIKVTALTVDHGLRTGSGAEAAQVGRWLSARGMDHHILTWTDGAAVRTRVQERARAARYALMADWCQAHGVRHILLAHHMEDQAETVLMRLKKGSGLLGLSGMASMRELHGRRDLGDGVQIVRPLLAVPKHQLRQTLRALGQDWIEDPSNSNLAFERVRTRHLLAHLEKEGVSAARLAGAARAIAQVRSVLESAAEQLAHKSVSGDGDGGDKAKRIAAKSFLAAPQTVQHIALARLLAEVGGGGGYDPSPQKMIRLLGWMARLGQGHKGDNARTLAGCEVRRLVQKGDVCFRIRQEGPRKSAQNHQNAAINCETTLAPDGQTSYIQGTTRAGASRLIEPCAVFPSD